MKQRKTILLCGIHYRLARVNADMSAGRWNIGTRTTSLPAEVVANPAQLFVSRLASHVLAAILTIILKPEERIYEASDRGA
jgi:hypothetical protein